MKNVMNILSTMMLVSVLASCGESSTDSATAAAPMLQPVDNDLGISAVPELLKETYTAALKFNRYTKVDTPNGNAIHIVAQDGITDNQIVRARAILKHYLTNYPGSIYGADKSAIANKMADNKAILILLNGVDDGTNPAANLDGQPLYFGEMQVEGHSWYINQDYSHRDASFEEILHMVHDTGIGVDQNATFDGTLPLFQGEIRAAQINAVSSNLWGLNAADWVAELATENSLTQEYLAAIIDVYYGLWGADTDSSTHGMNGLYVAKLRTDIVNKDSQGASLIGNKFFHPYLTYNARIDESFTGAFSLAYSSSLPYTHHSQYLKDVTLTGTNSSNVIINQLNNHITGNSAVNTVIFSGSSSEYQRSNKNGTVTVQDLQDNRDGTNTLIAIEKMQFSDTTMDIPDT